MKIVNLEAFLLLPAGTVFCKYTPSYLGEMMIKGDTMPPRDFCYQDIAESVSDREAFERAAETGESVALDLNCQGRDGCFEDTQLFAVFSADDVRAIVLRLQQALTEGYSQ